MGKMTIYLPRKLVYEELSDEQRAYLQERIPDNYNLREYIRDISELEEQIGSLSLEAREFAESKNYTLAGMTYLDITDLDKIYNTLRVGNTIAAKKLIDELETANRERIPSRLYRKFYEE
ncbi:hypothetical protein SMSP2_01798 [Limihaloglobus sulfuriphilus]|uniref:Uncharacterized protein n=1 Tax=Limihaloglobus sulfuriphilus TaxID=1851148 RepID=A0A1Q2MFJ8_9BACT|nr:hypothetical protein [Limihaloglobus sulfuriphilus]AQQ71424.1 hypothetical protein SMSP2_01798 [Limihaloglobus sulfuriphilus]